MAKVSLLLVFLVFTVALRATVDALCRQDDCPDTTGVGSSRYCSSRRDRVKCLRDIGDNLDCTDNQRDDANDAADALEGYADFLSCEAGACNLVSSLATCLGLTAIAYLFGRMK